MGLFGNKYKFDPKRDVDYKKKRVIVTPEDTRKAQRDFPTGGMSTEWNNMATTVLALIKSQDTTLYDAHFVPESLKTYYEGQLWEIQSLSSGMETPEHIGWFSMGPDYQSYIDTAIEKRAEVQKNIRLVKAQGSSIAPGKINTAKGRPTAFRIRSDWHQEADITQLGDAEE